MAMKVEDRKLVKKWRKQCQELFDKYDDYVDNISVSTILSLNLANMNATQIEDAAREVDGFYNTLKAELTFHTAEDLNINNAYQDVFEHYINYLHDKEAYGWQLSSQEQFALANEKFTTQQLQNEREALEMNLQPPAPENIEQEVNITMPDELVINQWADNCETLMEAYDDVIKDSETLDVLKQQLNFMKTADNPQERIQVIDKFYSYFMNTQLVEKSRKDAIAADFYKQALESQRNYLESKQEYLELNAEELTFLDNVDNEMLAVKNNKRYLGWIQNLKTLSNACPEYSFLETSMRKTHDYLQAQIKELEKMSIDAVLETRVLDALYNEFLSNQSIIMRSRNNPVWATFRNQMALYCESYLNDLREMNLQFEDKATRELVNQIKEEYEQLLKEQQEQEGQNVEPEVENEDEPEVDEETQPTQDDGPAFANPEFNNEDNSEQASPQPDFEYTPEFQAMLDSIVGNPEIQAELERHYQKEMAKQRKKEAKLAKEAAYEKALSNYEKAQDDLDKAKDKAEANKINEDKYLQAIFDTEEQIKQYEQDLETFELAQKDIDDAERFLTQMGVDNAKSRLETVKTKLKEIQKQSAKDLDTVAYLQQQAEFYKAELAQFSNNPFSKIAQSFQKLATNGLHVVSRAATTIGNNFKNAIDWAQGHMGFAPSRQGIKERMDKEVLKAEVIEAQTSATLNLERVKTLAPHVKDIEDIITKLQFNAFKKTNEIKNEIQAKEKELNRYDPESKRAKALAKNIDDLCTQLRVLKVNLAQDISQSYKKYEKKLDKYHDLAKQLQEINNTVEKDFLDFVEANAVILGIPQGNVEFVSQVYIEENLEKIVATLEGKNNHTQARLFQGLHASIKRGIMDSESFDIVTQAIANGGQVEINNQTVIFDGRKCEQLANFMEIAIQNHDNNILHSLDKLSKNHIVQETKDEMTTRSTYAETKEARQEYAGWGLRADKMNTLARIMGTEELNANVHLAINNARNNEGAR